MTTYSETLKTLASHLMRRGINYNLDHIINALNEMDNPHQNCGQIIHIAGTNGKGSTAQFIASGLLACGYKVGVFSSPHFESYRERIQLNNSPISEDDFVDQFEKIKPIPHFEKLSEFEVLTLLQFNYFKEKQPGFLILETGLGGRLDSTNVCSPLLSVITSISMDHMDILGDTIQEITKEKAGIIKPKTPVIVQRQHPSVLQILKKTAFEVQSPFIIVEPNEPVKNLEKVPDTFLKLNMKTALKALMHLPINFTKNQNKIEKAVAETVVWGRFTKIKRGKQTFILDATHNPGGAKKLREALESEYPNQKLTCVLGVQKNKDFASMFKELYPIMDTVYYDPFDKDITVPHMTFQTFTSNQVKETHIESIKDLPKDDVVVLTGSIYFLGKLKPLLTKT